MSSININSNDVNYGGKIATPSGYIKDFQTNLNYPIRNSHLPVYVKSFTPYAPYGNYIKYFNNYDRYTTISSLSSIPN